MDFEHVRREILADDKAVTFTVDELLYKFSAPSLITMLKTKEFAGKSISAQTYANLLSVVGDKYHNGILTYDDLLAAMTRGNRNNTEE